MDSITVAVAPITTVPLKEHVSNEQRDVEGLPIFLSRFPSRFWSYRLNGVESAFVKIDERRRDRREKGREDGRIEFTPRCTERRNKRSPIQVSDRAQRSFTFFDPDGETPDN